MVDGRLRVYYDGYWIRAYDVPADNLLAKKRLIEALTRRLFNHVEHGLNIPGTRLGEARHAFERESDPQRKRVKGAMLAGALFNRAADVITKLVEMQALGIEIARDNPLMQECGDHLQEALALGRMVLHRSGEEGIDELWGEPFKAFAFPVEDFYSSRYIKIAHAMRAVDQIVGELEAMLAGLAAFDGIAPLLCEFAQAARVKCETLRTDRDVFDVWASFVVAGERLLAFAPSLFPGAGECECAALGLALVRDAQELVFSIVRARVPMPKSTRALIERCRAHRARFATPALRVDERAAALRTPAVGGALTTGGR
jgi:hypothetical protein